MKSYTTKEILEILGERKAYIEGLARAKEIEMEEGAKHHDWLKVSDGFQSRSFFSDLECELIHLENFFAEQERKDT